MMNVPTCLPPSHTGLQGAPPVGQTLGGRYRILRRWGGGELGITYLAQELDSGTEVIVKMMRGHVFSDPRMAARFTSEANRLAALRHPNIVEMLDYGHEEGTAYLVMPFVRGRPLTALIHEQGHLSRAQFIPIAAQILKGVGYAHANEVMIRDLKSSNIMLCERKGRENYVMLLEFGLTKALREQESITPDSALATAGYLAPEVLTQGACGLAVDVYALGVLFWTMLCGRPPYQSDDDASVFHKTIHSPVPELKDSLPPGSDVPTALATLIEQSLAKRPGQRPANANEMVELLIECTPAALFRLPKLSGARRPRRPGEGNSGLIALTGVNPSGQYPKMVTNEARPGSSARPGTPHRTTPALTVPGALSADPSRNPISQRPFLVSRPFSPAVKPDSEANPQTIVVDVAPPRVPLPPLLATRADDSGTAPRIAGVPLVAIDAAPDLQTERPQDVVEADLPAAPADTEDHEATMTRQATPHHSKGSRKGALIGIAAALALVIGGMVVFADGQPAPDSAGALPPARDLSTSAVVSPPPNEPSEPSADAMDALRPSSAPAMTQPVAPVESAPEPPTAQAEPAPAVAMPTYRRRARRSSAPPPAEVADAPKPTAPDPVPDEAPAPDPPAAADIEPTPEVADVAEPPEAPAPPTPAPNPDSSRTDPADVLLQPVPDRRRSAGALMTPRDRPR